MSNPIVALCPGQGAQAVGMGRAWFERSPEAAAVFREADAILGGRFGRPLSEICFAGPEEVLNRTDVAQPALYVCGVASWRAMLAAGTLGPGATLAAAAGLSLGEYTALHVAGAMGFADGLELVALRGRAMQDAAEASKGGMVALIGAEEHQADELCAKALAGGPGGEVLVPANYNASGQIVISGSASACDRAVGVAEGMGLRATKLVVAGAFHSPLMQPAADRLRSALDRVPFTRPSAPVLSNVTASPHCQPPPPGALTEHSFEVGVRLRLARQLTEPVRWSQSCLWLAAQVRGAYHELAPGKVLAGLMRRIDRNIKVTSHDTPDLPSA
ncbi:MAG: ACP S-malonyltransferase [Phycisphaerales bacterium]|nr:ACP S-malonyltransferase [Phycisphaerales bacterium]